MLRPALLATLLIAAPALAGAPYLTDDPQPTDRGHWQIYTYITASTVPGRTTGLTGLDISHGVATDLELNLTLPTAYDRSRAAKYFNIGDISAAAKVKILHQRDGSWMPDIAVAPRLFLPTAPRPLDTGHARFFLPVYGEKDWGKWNLWGGGGWMHNPGAGQRNYWFWGVAMARELSDKLTIGAELYHQTAATRPGLAYFAANVGLTRKLGEHLLLLASGGPGLQHARTGGRLNAYLGLEAVY
jgi:hypothetical protein